MTILNPEKLMKKYPNIPGPTIGGIVRYINDRTTPGGFVTAVLTNDFLKAFYTADIGNTNAMKDIAMLVFNDIPDTSHGSVKIVTTWLNGSAVTRLEKED